MKRAHPVTAFFLSGAEAGRFRGAITVFVCGRSLFLPALVAFIGDTGGGDDGDR